MTGSGNCHKRYSNPPRVACPIGTLSPPSPEPNTSRSSERMSLSGLISRSACNSRNSDGYSQAIDRKSTRLNSSHVRTSYAVFCLKNKSVLSLSDETRSAAAPDTPSGLLPLGTFQRVPPSALARPVPGCHQDHLKLSVEVQTAPSP